MLAKSCTNVAARNAANNPTRGALAINRNHGIHATQANHGRSKGGSANAATAAHAAASSA
jgi:hypothetical protein